MISRSKLEHVEAEKRRAYANLESARYAAETVRYALEEARNALSHFAAEGKEMQGEHVAIHSPVDDQILAVYHESEGTVATGQVLLEIGNTQALEVVVEVLSADAARIQPSMLVEFGRWGDEQQLPVRCV